MRGNDRIDECFSECLKSGQRAFFVNTHQSTITCDIRRQHCRQSPFETAVGQRRAPCTCLLIYQSMEGGRRDRLNSIAAWRRNGTRYSFTAPWPFDPLSDLEALELRVIQIQSLVVPCLTVRSPERLRFGPTIEHRRFSHTGWEV